jgi:hypothetical protein
MKHTIIQVHPGGTRVQLVLHSGASSGQAFIVVSDGVEILRLDVVPENGHCPKAPSASKDNGRAPTPTASKDPDVIVKRLIKMNTKDRVGAVNSIKAMFQFTEAITNQGANEILEDLRRRGDLTIDCHDKITFPKSQPQRV